MSEQESHSRRGAAPQGGAAGPAPAGEAPQIAAAAGAGAAAPHGAARLAAPTEPLPRMGGIALRNGLVLVSDDYWAAAIRESGGTISVSSGRKTRLPSGRSRRGAGRAGGHAAQGARASAGAQIHTGAKPSAGAKPRATLEVADFQGLPLVRGLARFAETLLVVAQVKLRMPQAEMPLEGGRVALALATAYAATETVRAVGPKSRIAQETGAALAAFVPAVLSLKSSTISGYHGAEHKVIAGREAEMRAEAAGVTFVPEAGYASAAAAAPKEHERCGSNLVGPLLFTTIAANALLRGKSGRMAPAAQALAGAVSLGAALEALRWATRHGDSLAARVMMSPGRLVQKTLTTSEPTPDQLEVAQRAMKELLRLEAAAAGA
jgi:hypothetical protein